jgi:hypothetical protein
MTAGNAPETMEFRRTGLARGACQRLISVLSVRFWTNPARKSAFRALFLFRKLLPSRFSGVILSPCCVPS